MKETGDDHPPLLQILGIYLCACTCMCLYVWVCILGAYLCICMCVLCMFIFIWGHVYVYNCVCVFWGPVYARRGQRCHWAGPAGHQPAFCSKSSSRGLRGLKCPGFLWLWTYAGSRRLINPFLPLIVGHKSLFSIWILNLSLSFLCLPFNTGFLELDR